MNKLVEQERARSEKLRQVCRSRPGLNVLIFSKKVFGKIHIFEIMYFSKNLCGPAHPGEALEKDSEKAKRADDAIRKWEGDKSSVFYDFLRFF